ncbi:MAG: phosphate ABC transporter permease PstA [Bifidobacteriaceae bacterium]|nr:phosphate ABC transporter permease PstA [Bifidobacteriaceae bacterium]
MALKILALIATVVTLALIGGMMIFILIKGVPFINQSLFEVQYNSENQSLFSSVVDTVLMTVIALSIAGILGIGAAIYLAEYTHSQSKLVVSIRYAFETLAGIPSIIYGLFGMLLFVVYFKMGYSLLAGSLTLAIMCLPLVMRTTEEALLAVPTSYREGSLALGAGRLRTIFQIVLPAANPGIVSGLLLGVGRIMGETAALIFTAGTVAALPASLFSSVRTLSVHMYVLASEGLYIDKAYATAVVLLALVAVINVASWLMSARLERKNYGSA